MQFNSEAGGRCDKSRVWDEVLVLACVAVQISGRIKNEPRGDGKCGLGHSEQVVFLRNAHAGIFSKQIEYRNGVQERGLDGRPREAVGMEQFVERQRIRR